jgi:hypothetical protein
MVGEKVRRERRSTPAGATPARNSPRLLPAALSDPAGNRRPRASVRKRRRLRENRVGTILRFPFTYVANKRRKLVRALV